MQKTEFIVVIGTIQSYLAKWGERLNFGNSVAEIARKVWERRKMSDVMGREKKMNFSNEITEILVLPNSCPWSAPVHARGSAWMVYQLWQPSCRNCRELRREKIWIVATKLPKMGGKKKELWLPKAWGGIKKKKCYIHNIFTTFSQQITSD